MADPPPAAAPMRVEGRVLAGALEMRHDGGGGQGYYIAARADIPAGAVLLQVLMLWCSECRAEKSVCRDSQRRRGRMSFWQHALFGCILQYLVNQQSPGVFYRRRRRWRA